MQSRGIDVDRGVEFFVDTILLAKDGGKSYVGYVNSGGSISLGDVFHVAYVIPRTIEDVRMERPLSPPVNIRSVCLSVESIEVMRQKVQQLSHGITAIVRLAGEGDDLLLQGDWLSTA